jgi:rubredoxin
MARANAIMHLDADLGDERRIVPAGTRVRFEFLPWTFQ